MPSQTVESAYVAARQMYLDGASISDVGPHLRRARQELDQLTERAVRQAIGRETWKTIGSALGVTRQAARKRYGPS